MTTIISAAGNEKKKKKMSSDMDNFIFNFNSHSGIKYKHSSLSKNKCILFF